MSDARATILGRIDAALRSARIPRMRSTAAVPDGTHAGSYAERIERFASEARALGIDVYIEASEQAVRNRLTQVIDGRRVLSWNPEHLPYAAASVLGAPVTGTSPLEQQAAADIGVTACHGAIAETGSLALISEPGCSRTVSLLPPLHVALVQPRDLYDAMHDFFMARARDIASASNLTFVTGPSRTADIELSLTIGVHGPGRVVVIVGPDQRLGA